MSPEPLSISDAGKGKAEIYHKKEQFNMRFVASTSIAESTMIDTTKMADILTSTMIPSTTRSTGNTGFTETTSFEDITSSENNQITYISTIASTLSESQSSHFRWCRIHFG
jgi:hypothetical protein